MQVLEGALAFMPRLPKENVEGDLADVGTKYMQTVSGSCLVLNVLSRGSPMSNRPSPMSDFLLQCPVLLAARTVKPFCVYFR
jgi:hypothetical protein